MEDSSMYDSGCEIEQEDYLGDNFIPFDTPSGVVQDFNDYYEEAMAYVVPIHGASSVRHGILIKLVDNEPDCVVLAYFPPCFRLISLANFYIARQTALKYG
jgi:hypothetical protein